MVHVKLLPPFGAWASHQDEHITVVWAAALSSAGLFPLPLRWLFCCWGLALCLFVFQYVELVVRLYAVFGPVRNVVLTMDDVTFSEGSLMTSSFPTTHLTVGTDAPRHVKAAII